MKLVAIFCVWDDWDLFYYSYKNIEPLVDGIIVVYSQYSNFGEYKELESSYLIGRGKYSNFEPTPSLDPRDNETAKRNYGIQQAREAGYTHFLMMDADEFYEPAEFIREKKRIEDSISKPAVEIEGLVCRVKCYFRSPTLTIGYDTTLVPFIHKLTPQIACEFNQKYPFAWTGQNGVAFTNTKQIRIDPTRSMNINTGVEWSDITMHHLSWVRRDIKKKIRNSTARANIERSTIVTDYRNAKRGYFCQFYGKTLEESPNVFGLPNIEDATIQYPVPATSPEFTNRSI